MRKSKIKVDTRNDAWKRNRHRFGLYALLVVAAVVLGGGCLTYIYVFHAGSYWAEMPVEDPALADSMREYLTLVPDDGEERLSLWDEKGDPVPMPADPAKEDPNRTLYYGGMKVEDGVTYFRFDANRAGTAYLHMEIEEADISGGWYFRLLPFFGKVLIVDTRGYFEGCLSLSIALVLFFALLSLVTGNIAWNLKRRALFSYRLVVNSGICLFATCQFAITTLLAVRNFSMMQRFALFDNLVDGIRHSTIITAPVMLIGAILVAISNIQLIRHEGFRSKNLLGIFIALAWMGMLLLFAFFGRDFAGSWEEVKRLIAMQTAVAAVMNYGFFLLLSTVLCGYFAQRHLPALDKDYIIILGCRIRKDGTPTPILRGRVDRALAFEKEQFEKTGRHAVFVPSGGQGPDEPTSEAESMRQYLLAQGVPDERILPEGKSVNTFQNIRNSKKLILSDNPKARVAFSTTNYHVFRSYVLSKDNDLYAEGMAAKTKGYFFPNAFLREFFGLLYSELIPIALVLVGILASYLTFVGFLW